MLKYFISCFILLCSFVSIAQNKELDTINTIKEIKRDSVGEFYNPKTYGLRIGFDLVKPVLSFSNDDIKGAEVVADYRINTRLYAAGEMGYTQRTIQEDYFNHTAKGTYLKLGVNYNLYTNWLDMDNETYLGVRYGTSIFNNELNNYKVYQYGDYFDPKTGNGIKYNNLNAHWLELVAGIKVETFKNLFLGFMVSFSRLITTNDPDNFKNTYSPGIGKISKTGAGANINYTITYRIPLYKK
ncbi:hypothetical protein AXE80_04760 [Wenyingzhuangia fucanilytica]|uniref:Outer membrane protein beta-barrel domain-containing protein n=1 Tax=Wenyingzhuangia fucanilytica TaxID=1790137 RepID=A0A1B1Y4E7_9FLAO|nr:DUF6048 family protein [Wenyingzhuangia fucanilytica]ANW95630.1 hypothetical protein AXE80_04760 [Wenyingzhuangia fucanilytica]